MFNASKLLHVHYTQLLLDFVSLVSSHSPLVPPRLILLQRSVGYFNYRYFFNFLVFVGVGMIYGALLSYRPFRNLAKHEYWDQIRQAQQQQQQQHLQQNTPIQHQQQMQVMHLYPMVPIPSEKLPITLSFMLCISVGIAVFCLGGFHLYLILTAQTTIEFHGACMRIRLCLCARMGVLTIV